MFGYREVENELEKLPDIFNYDFNIKESEKPWVKDNGANRDQYFNYGLNE